MLGLNVCASTWLNEYSFLIFVIMKEKGLERWLMSQVPAWSQAQDLIPDAHIKRQVCWDEFAVPALRRQRQKDPCGSMGIQPSLVGEPLA